MRIVVTGGGGFIGREIIKLLIQSGQNSIVAVDNSLASLADMQVDKIEGDISQKDVLSRAFTEKVDAVIHLAVVPGGAAEANPELAWEINVEATRMLIDIAIESGSNPRFILASSVAVFGYEKPPLVEDSTPVIPYMYYGAHKAMMEQWLAMQSRRGVINGISLRLPGIIARPKSPSGMKSAFMSNVFHALLNNETFVCPVSAETYMWFMSVNRVAENFCHALTLDEKSLPDSRALTLPALRLNMGMLVSGLYSKLNLDEKLVSYEVDEQLEIGFGGYPVLISEAAEKLGFKNDGDIETMISTVLNNLS